MTKVKILSAEYADILERMVNEFVSNRMISDIEFSACRGAVGIIYSAMIVYVD